VDTPYSQYKQILLPDTEDGLVHREVSRDDNAFADLVASSLLSLIGRRPAPVSGISQRLQGNLCEFCVWEIGEHYWGLYTRNCTATANAKSPWRDLSKSGVDILAVDEQSDTVFLIEIKSTCEGGSSAVADDEDSLKADFRHLFEGSLEERIWGSVDELVAHLVIQGDRSLADTVIGAVGSKPEDCTGTTLVAVLVCRSGKTQRSHNARKQAFQRLHKWLLAQGWKKAQCEYRSVELSDFRAWLSRIVEKVTE
jgi:hypothetical protein